MGNLENKIAVVTGAARGLGEAICHRLAREGCDLALADINEAGAGETAEAVRGATGRQARALRVDISSEKDVKTLFDATLEQFGRIDVVVANAAILFAEPIADADPKRWKSVMNVNLFGYFLTAKFAAKIMIEQRSGSIIQINSKSGKKGSAANSAYAASKFGGIGLTQSVALELARYGVRCNAVCPGNLLDGPLWADPENGLFVQYLKAGKVPGAKTTDDVRKHYEDQVPLGRGCTYEDICDAVVFLASDQSCYMTGQAINITGGQEMR
jgi:sorbitol-6-phosphate 2-dehydrogenase